MGKYTYTKPINAEQFNQNTNHPSVKVRKDGDDCFGVLSIENGFSIINDGDYILFDEDGNVTGKMAKDEFEATHTKVAEPVANDVAPVEETHEEVHEETKAE